MFCKSDKLLIIKYCLILLAGWLFSHLILSLFRPYSIGPIVILPGFVVLFYNITLLLRNVYNSRLYEKQILFCSGIISDSLLYWSLRVDGNYQLKLMDLWVHEICFSSLLTLICMCLFIVVVSRLKKTEKVVRFSGITHTTCLAFIPLLIIIIFRLSYLLTIEIPNTERSFFIGSTEIHHAFIGTVLILICNCIAITNIYQKNLLFVFSLSLSIGLIVDQSLYIPQRYMSDSGYNNIISWIGAVVGGFSFTIFVIILHLLSGKDHMRNNFAKLLSHRVRGYSEFEHIPSAFKMACESRVPYIEIDTRVSKDGEIFVYHDIKTNSCLTEQKKFSETNASLIKKINYRNHEKILSLDEALDMFTSRKYADQVLCIDIKDFGYEQKHLNLVRHYNLEKNVIFVSWIPQSLIALKKLNVQSSLILSHWNLIKFGRISTTLCQIMGNRLIRIFHFI